MIGSAVVTIVCWGGFAFLVASALIRDLMREHDLRSPRGGTQIHVADDFSRDEFEQELERAFALPSWEPRA